LVLNVGILDSPQRERRKEDRLRSTRDDETYRKLREKDK